MGQQNYQSTVTRKILKKIKGNRLALPDVLVSINPQYSRQCGTD